MALGQGDPETRFRQVIKQKPRRVLILRGFLF